MKLCSELGQRLRLIDPAGLLKSEVCPQVLTLQAYVSLDYKPSM